MIIIEYFKTLLVLLSILSVGTFLYVIHKKVEKTTKIPIILLVGGIDIIAQIIFLVLLKNIVIIDNFNYEVSKTIIKVLEISFYMLLVMLPSTVMYKLIIRIKKIKGNNGENENEQISDCKKKR